MAYDADMKEAFKRINIPRAAILGLVALYTLSALNNYWIYRSAFSFVPAIGMPLFLVGVAVVTYLLKNKIRITKTLVFLLALSSLGLFYMAIFPPFMVPDSFFHYRSSYMYSNILLGLPSSEGMDIPMRACDIEFSNAFLGAGLNLNREHYALLFNLSFWLPTDCSLAMFEQSSLHQFDEQFGTTTAATFPYIDANPFQLRIVSAIGMALGRLIGLGPLPVFYLGELFNLALYVCLVGWATRITPTGKRIMMAISLLPMALHLASSYSYDVAIIGFSFLLIAFINKLLKTENSMSARDMILISVLVVLISPCKFVYACIAVLVLLIPKARFSSNKVAIAYKLLVIMLALLSIIAFRLPAVLQMADLYLSDSAESIQVEQADTIGNHEKESAELETDPDNNTEANGRSKSAPITIGYAINHPNHIISLIASTFNLSLDEYIATSIGSRLAWLDTRIQSPWWLIILFIGVLVASMIPFKEDSLSFKQRAGFLSTGLAIILLIVISFVFSMTSTTDISIVGVQGRYFLPILPLVLMAIAPKKNTLETHMDLTYTVLGSGAVLNIMYLSHIFSIAMA